MFFCSSSSLVVAFLFLHLILMKYCSVDARCSFWQRYSHHTTYVFSPLTLPDKMEGFEGLSHSPSDTKGAQATDAGLFPDNVVAQPWHRHSRGERGTLSRRMFAASHHAWHIIFLFSVLFSYSSFLYFYSWTLHLFFKNFNPTKILSFNVYVVMLV